jgi:hypothetical protein
MTHLTWIFHVSGDFGAAPPIPLSLIGIGCSP